MPKSRAVPGETNRQGKPLGSGTSSQKRRAERAERFGPGSERGGLEFRRNPPPEEAAQQRQQEEEEEDPRNRVEPATSSSQAGNWWEDPRNRAASSSSQAGNWWEWEDPRNRAASSSSQAAKWWEKDHDEGEEHRWYQSEQSQGPWSSQSSHQTWWENWEQPSWERSYSKQWDDWPQSHSKRWDDSSWSQSHSKQWDSWSRNPSKEGQDDELMEASVEDGYDRSQCDPVFLRERQRAFDETSSDRSRTPRKQLPTVPEVPPEGLPIVGAETKAAAKTKPSKEGQTTAAKSKPLKEGKGSAASSKPEGKGSAASSKPLKEGKGSTTKSKPLKEGQGSAAESKPSKEGTPPLRAGRVCVDFHQTLQLNQETFIRPMWRESIVALKKAGWEVCIVSFVTPNNREERLQEIWGQLGEAKLTSEIKGLWTCKDRSGPSGKTRLAKELGCTAIIDDAPEILAEALEAGLVVFPITTRRERHEALKKAGVTVYRDLPSASEALLCRMIDPKDL